MEAKTAKQCHFKPFLAIFVISLHNFLGMCRNPHHHFVQNPMDSPYSDYSGYWKLQLI